MGLRDASASKNIIKKHPLIFFSNNKKLAKIMCISLESDAGGNLWTAASAFLHKIPKKPFANLFALTAGDQI